MQELMWVQRTQFLCVGGLMSTKHISTTQITDNNKLKSIQIFLNTEYCVYQLYLLPIVKFEIPFTSKTKILSTLSPSLFLSLSSTELFLS